MKEKGKFLHLPQTQLLVAHQNEYSRLRKCWNIALPFLKKALLLFVWTLSDNEIQIFQIRTEWLILL
jgi:hypothetical protein